MTKSYGIIGWPLGHTMSPTLHNWGFGQLGIDARYEAWPLEPGGMAGFMERVRHQPVSGASVTIPHKQTVMAHVDTLTDRAKGVGAVNTLYWDGDTLCGDNTDVLGLIAPLKRLDTLPHSAMVLGAGGAARAAVYGLLELGIADVAVANRTRVKAETLAEDFSVRCVDWADRMDESPGLILNTTPLGMLGGMVDRTPWDGDRFPAGTVAYDIVYNPLETRFLKEAEAAGCTTVSGLEMFLHQGLAQFRLWTGQDMDEDGARAVLLAALGELTPARNGPYKDAGQKNKVNAMHIVHKFLLATAMACCLIAGSLSLGADAEAAGPNPVVVMDTSMGRIMIMLYPDKTPVTVKNFLKYVDAGFYDGTIFHRVVDQKKSPQQPYDIIQGGGFTYPLKRKQPLPPIVNEAAAAPSNTAGTIAMARASNPDSATCEFFFNVTNNTVFDFVPSPGWGKNKTPVNAGYCVFGKVVRGMDVLQDILKVKTIKSGRMTDIPAKPVYITKAYRAQ